MTPEKIRDIRLSLGLTQVRAGELLGGGPRAFSKYEAGSVKPAASVVRLLTLLENDPGKVTYLGGGNPQPINAHGIGPFEVSGQHISVLAERDLAALLRMLLIAEAQTHGLPLDGIHVASNIFMRDGGEDGRIEWAGGPDRTTFLPSRFCQFQLKSGPMSNSDAGKDVLTRGGDVKAMVLGALSSAGNYIQFCTQSYTKQEVQSRKSSILCALRQAGLPVNDKQVDFWDADQAAMWVNQHPSVVAWVREQTQSAGMEPFRSWDHWSGRSEHDLHGWVDDDRLSGLRAWLLEKLSIPRGSCRIVGLSGIGKSRLTLEALCPPEESNRGAAGWREVVLYAVESEAPSDGIIEAVQKFADTGARLVIVVDDCSLDTHRKLAGIVARANSRVSLLTIDHEIASAQNDEMTLRVEEAPPTTIQGIIDQLRGLDPDDRRRLEHFSKGFPGVALRIVRAWRNQIPVAHATEDDLVEAFVLGRNPRNPESLLKTATLVATLGLVQVEPSPYQVVGDDYGQAVQLHELLEISDGMTADQLHSDIQELLGRGVLQRRGNVAMLQPRPIALNLAGRQWRRWAFDKWEQVLGGSSSTSLKVSASEQLAMLNTTEIARKVVGYVCRLNGPFRGKDGVEQSGHARVLSKLAEIEAADVARVIESYLADLDDLYEVRDGQRRDFVHALEKIAFREDTFEEGAALLLLLASAENEEWANNATEQFQALFPMFLGGTAAGAESRFRVLDDALTSKDVAQLKVVAGALFRGCATRHFARLGNAGSHGSRPNLVSWHPATDGKAHSYVEGCVLRLVQLAHRKDELGSETLSNLGNLTTSLISDGFTDVVEGIVDSVNAEVSYWPEALEGLGWVLRHDSIGIYPEEADRVREMIRRLQPEDVESRLRLVVTEMSWDYPDDENLEVDAQRERQSEAVRQLAEELVQKPEMLSTHLEELCRVRPRGSSGRVPQRRTFEFGSAIAEFSSSPEDWLKPIVESVLAVPDQERDLGLLSGLVSRLAVGSQETELQLKQLISGSSDLAPCFPSLCLRMGLKAPDIGLVIEAIEAGRLPAAYLRCWALGGQLSKLPSESVAPLFDAMLVHSDEAYRVGLDLMFMYVRRDMERLEELRPQIILAVKNVAERGLGIGRADVGHDFSEIVAWMLGKGREDDDALAVALELAKILAKARHYDEHRLFAPLVPALLSGFPEIVWQVIGPAILTGPGKALVLRTLLRRTGSIGRMPNAPILSLPEKVLFDWCHAYPDGAPAFAAEAIPMLSSYKLEDPKRTLHPLMSRLIDEFGDRDDVWSAMWRNLHSFGWSGSAAPYFDLFTEPLSSLGNHPKRQVRIESKRMLRGLDFSASSARDHDNEWTARGEL